MGTLDSIRYTRQNFVISFWLKDGLVSVSVLRQCDEKEEEARRVKDGFLFLKSSLFEFPNSVASPTSKE